MEIPKIQWYPGHIAKAEKKLSEVINRVDLIIEVRDARIPLSTGHPHLNKWITNKKHILVINREDMIAPETKKNWSEWFKKNNMKRPFSFYGLESGSKVRFNIENIKGVVSAKNIEPSDYGLPVIDNKTRSGFLRKLPSPSSLYGFVVVDDKWDFLARKADFVNPDDWDTAENTMLTFILKDDNEQGFRATHIQKEEKA